MPEITTTFEGMNTLEALVRAMPGRLTNFIRDEMVEMVFDAFDQSQIQVPRKTGALAGSGGIEVTSENPLEITIGYGGASAGYALWVHENLAARHKSPTKAKYLEDPFNAAAANVDGRISSKIDGAIIGSYPQAPSMAAADSTAKAVAAHTGHGTKRGAKHRAEVRKAQPMTHEDFTLALRAISRGHRQAAEGRRVERYTYRVRRKKPKK